MSLAHPGTPGTLERRALWVAFLVVVVTRCLRGGLRALSAFLGFGFKDEDEQLGIKHNKSAGTKAGKGAGKGGGKGGKGGGGGKRAAAAAEEASEESDEDARPMGVVKKGGSSGGGGGKRSFRSKGGGGGGEEASHTLHLNTLKGHTDTVNAVAFSGDGRAIVTACDDMTVRLFRLDSVQSKNPHILRIPLDKERATGVSFAAPGASGTGAADSIVTLGASPSGEACLTRYAISATAAPEVKFQKKRAMDSKRSISLSCGGGGEGTGTSGAPIRIPPVVVSSADDTEVRVWAADTGLEIARLDTLQFKNHNAAISPDGRFIAAAAFTADVKIWEVLRSKQGAPLGIDAKHAVMLLKGHRGAVHWVAFTHDAKGAVTVSKDRTMKLWNIDVRYGVNEDPKVVASMDLSGEITGAQMPTRVAVSPSGVIAVVVGAALVFYGVGEPGSEVKAGGSGGFRRLERVEAAHGGEEVTWMEWARQAHRLDDGTEADVLATAGADRKAKLWRAPQL